MSSGPKTTIDNHMNGIREILATGADAVLTFQTFRPNKPGDKVRGGTNLRERDAAERLIALGEAVLKDKVKSEMPPKHANIKRITTWHQWTLGAPDA